MGLIDILNGTCLVRSRAFSKEPSTIQKAAQSMKQHY